MGTEGDAKRRFYNQDSSGYRERTLSRSRMKQFDQNNKQGPEVVRICGLMPGIKAF